MSLAEAERPVEFFYDLDSQIAVLLGGAALLGAFTPRNSDHIKELIRHKRLAIITDSVEDIPLISDVLEGLEVRSGEPQNLRAVGRLLDESSPRISAVGKFLFKGISKEACISFGHWAQEQVDIYNPAAALDIKLIERANALGLGPSVKMLTDRFGNLTQYYIELENPRTLRKNQFSSWPDQRFVRYLASIGQIPNSPPSMRYINQLSKESAQNPPFSSLIKRFGGGNNALELAGYWIIPKWDDADYIEWGLQLALANAGYIPMMRQIYTASANGLGPASSNIAKRFGSISSFQDKIRKELSKYSSNQRLLMKGLNQKHFESFELFSGDRRSDTQSDLKLYARNLLLSQLPGFCNLAHEKKLALCRSTESLDFIPALANLNRSLSMADIKKVARALDIYSYVSSARHYQDLLKIPQEVPK